MKSKQQKSQELKNLADKLPQSEITIFTTFSRTGAKGLSVAQMQEFKRALRSLGSEYIVTKKTLIDKAVKEGKYEGVSIYDMEGSAGLVLGTPSHKAADGQGTGDAYGIAKKVYEFAKKNEALQFFGALFGGKFIDREHFLEMALMPTRETLLARLFGMMRYPLTSLAIVLSETAKKKELTV